MVIIMCPGEGVGGWTGAMFVGPFDNNRDAHQWADKRHMLWKLQYILLYEED